MYLCIAILEETKIGQNLQGQLLGIQHNLNKQLKMDMSSN